MGEIVFKNIIWYFWRFLKSTFQLNIHALRNHMYSMLNQYYFNYDLRLNSQHWINTTSGALSIANISIFIDIETTLNQYFCAPREVRLRKNKTEPANNIKKLKSIHDFWHFQTFKLVNHLRLCFFTYFHGFAIPSPTFSL